MVPNYKRESLKPSPPLHPSPTVKRRRLVPAKHHKSVKGWMRWVWFLQPWAPPVLVTSWLKSHFKRGGGLTFVWDGLSIYTRHKLYLRSVDTGHTWPFFLSLHPPPTPKHTHTMVGSEVAESACAHTSGRMLFIYACCTLAHVSRNINSLQLEFSLCPAFGGHPVPHTICLTGSSAPSGETKLSPLPFFPSGEFKHRGCKV